MGRLSSVPCRAAKGDDRLVWSSFSLFTGPEQCRGHGDVTVRGNAGDDVLLGGQLDDVLLGGVGVDSANGGQGTDRCRAEAKVKCEQR